MITPSLPKMYIKPARMKTSATSAVVLSFARLRMRANGRKMIICRRMKYWMPSSVAQLVMARVNDCKFSETKMMYALTKPIWEIAIEERIA